MAYFPQASSLVSEANRRDLANALADRPLEEQLIGSILQEFRGNKESWQSQKEEAALLLEKFIVLIPTEGPLQGEINELFKILQDTEHFKNPNNHILMMMGAVKSGNLAVVKRLLNVGVALDVFDSEGKTPLDYAVENNQFAVMEFIEDRLSDSLLRAVKAKDVSAVRALLDAGADPYSLTAQGEYLPFICHALVSKERDLKYPVEIIDALDEFGPERAIGEEILARKWIAHIFSIGGKSKIEIGGELHEFSLERFEPRFVTKRMHALFAEFVKNKSEISSSEAKAILKALKRPLVCSDFSLFDPPASVKGCVEKLKSDLESGVPRLIIGGSFEHVVNIVISKIGVEPPRYALTICNRGEGAEDGSEGKLKALMVYHLNQDELTEELLISFLKRYCDMLTFKTNIRDRLILRLSRSRGYKRAKSRVIALGVVLKLRYCLC